MLNWLQGHMCSTVVCGSVLLFAEKEIRATPFRGSLFALGASSQT
jgi:hypothetical protein